MEIRTIIKVLKLTICVKESVWINKSPEETSKNCMKSEKSHHHTNLWSVSRLGTVASTLKLDSDILFMTFLF